MTELFLPTGRVELLQFLSSALFENILSQPEKYHIPDISFFDFFNLRETELSMHDEIKIAILTLLLNKQSLLLDICLSRLQTSILMQHHLSAFFYLDTILFTHTKHPHAVEALLSFQIQAGNPSLLCHLDPSLDSFLTHFDSLSKREQTEVTTIVNQSIMNQIKILVNKFPEESPDELIHAIWFFIFQASKNSNPQLIQFLFTLTESEQTVFFHLLMESFNLNVLEFLQKKDKQANGIKRHKETLDILFSHPFFASLAFKYQITSFFCFCDFETHRRSHPEYFIL